MCLMRTKIFNDGVIKVHSVVRNYIFKAAAARIIDYGYYSRHVANCYTIDLWLYQSVK